MEQSYHTIADIQSGYDQWAASYDQVLVGGWRYRAPLEVASQLGPLLAPGLKMIDLACGTGLNTEQYPALEVIGVDFADGMLREYGKKGFAGQKADIRSLPFQDDSFDVALCVAALENYADPSPIIAEMKRIVKDQGLLAFTVCLSPMDGCHQTSEKEIDRMLESLALRKQSSFEFVSHYEYANEERPIIYLGVICLNTKGAALHC